MRLILTPVCLLCAAHLHLRCISVSSIACEQSHSAGHVGGVLINTLGALEHLCNIGVVEERAVFLADICGFLIEPDPKPWVCGRGATWSHVRPRIPLQKR